MCSGHQGAGKYSFKFDASGLASGIYIYRLTTGEKTFVKKYTFIR